MMYFPPVFDTATADRLGVESHLERWIAASGQPIGWKRAAPVQPAHGKVLVVHGNAGTAIQCAHYADVIQQVADFDVFLLEFPGYADREGKPTETSLEASAVEGIENLATNTPVYVVGESLGTGVAAYLAGRCPDQVTGVALLAPYNSLTSVAQWHAPVLPVHLLLVDRFPAGKFLQNYHGPVAMLVGGVDQVVPEKFGQRLFNQYAGPKHLWEFPAADHGAVMQQPPEIWRQIFAFLREAPEK